MENIDNLILTSPLNLDLAISMSEDKKIFTKEYFYNLAIGKLGNDEITPEGIENFKSELSQYFKDFGENIARILGEKIKELGLPLKKILFSTLFRGSRLNSSIEYFAFYDSYYSKITHTITIENWSSDVKNNITLEYDRSFQETDSYVNWLNCLNKVYEITNGEVYNFLYKQEYQEPIHKLFETLNIMATCLDALNCEFNTVFSKMNFNRMLKEVAFPITYRSGRARETYFIIHKENKNGKYQFSKKDYYGMKKYKNRSEDGMFKDISCYLSKSWAELKKYFS